MNWCGWCLEMLGCEGVSRARGRREDVRAGERASFGWLAGPRIGTRGDGSRGAWKGLFSDKKRKQGILA